jgi:NapH/MauN family ferredoxin-type protein
VWSPISEGIEFLNMEDLRPFPEKKEKSFLRRVFPSRQACILFDPSKCSGCGTCEMICAARNVSKVAPTSSSVKIIRDEKKGGTFAIFCQHCREPVCVEVCPTRAIEKGEDGIVRIDNKFCVECGLCTIACPEAAPLVEPGTGKVRKCDLCEGNPLCVEHCPEQALSFSRGKSIGWIRFLRWPVQFLSFLLLVVILVGTFCSFRAGVVDLACPTGVLQNISSSKTIILVSVASAMVLLIMTVIAGRIFCGWICPFGFVLDLAGKITPKLGLPAFFRARMAKYGILLASIGSSYAMGFQVFCTVCPIGTLCRSFGAKEVFRGAELAIIPALAALEIGERRTWCRYFCPVGALLALTAKLGLIKIVIGATKCKKFSCMQCAEVCPMGIIDKDSLMEGISPKILMSECTLCMRCIDRCPYDAAKIRFRWQKVVPGKE